MLRPPALLLRMVTRGPYYGFIVRRSVRQVLKGVAGTAPSIVDWLFYGATYIDPKHLAIWYLVRTNDDLRQAGAAGLDQRLRDATRAALKRNGYPASAVSEAHVGLESAENVDKAGGWYRYFH